MQLFDSTKKSLDAGPTFVAGPVTLDRGTAEAELGAK
jgi:hypothetical protein